MKFKRLAVWLGVAAAFGAGAVSQAHAGAMAQSVLEVTNFVLTNGSGTPLVFGGPTPDVNVVSFQDALTNHADLNGTPSNEFKNQNGPPFVAAVDANAACVGACGPFLPNANNFTPASVPPTTSYSRSDNLLTGTPVTVSPLPPTTGANAHTIGETSLPGNSSGSSTSNILLTSTLQFTLNHDIGTLGVQFDDLSFLRTWTSLDSLPGSQAGAGLKWEITLSNGATNLIDWIPNGLVNSGGTQVGLTESADGCSLNVNGSAGFADPQAPTANCPASTFYSAVTNFVLPARNAAGQLITYSFTIDHHVSTQAVNVVPEPTTLALLGLSLLGIGFAARRRNV